MPTRDEQRRPRRAGLWAVLLVALAVAVPVLALVVHEPGSRPSGTQRLTSSTPRTATPTPTPTATAAPVAKGRTRALFFGDSYFIGGGYTDESNSMARIASNRLGWVSEINGGGGTGFVQANPEYDLPNFLGQIEDGAFDVGRRSWVVIEGGNDDRFLDMAQVGKNARKVLRIAQRRFPGATVVLVGPLDTDGDYADTTPVHKVLRKAARKRGVAYRRLTGVAQGALRPDRPRLHAPVPPGPPHLREEADQGATEPRRLARRARARAPGPGPPPAPRPAAPRAARPRSGPGWPS